MAQSEKIEISNLTRETIVNTLVEPYYKDMVKTTIHGYKIGVLNVKRCKNLYLFLLLFLFLDLKKRENKNKN